MRSTSPSGLGMALAWFAFPLVPTLLGTAYHDRLNWGFAKSAGPDPRDWGWPAWLILAGPLVGYGFLAGATIDLPDDEIRRGWRGRLARRSLWVAVGPWSGAIALGSIYLGLVALAWAYPPGQAWSLPFPSLPDWAKAVMVISLFIAPLGFGWLVVAWAALRRARRLGRARRSLAKGLGVAVAFVGSLFGSFWAITEAWRGYFFDPRIVPAIVAAASLALMLGCANTETYGEVRRRELFQAMLPAWLLGLALAWRWWSRSRPKAH